MNYCLGSLVVRGINGVREDDAVVLSLLQISCLLGWAEGSIHCWWMMSG